MRMTPTATIAAILLVCTSPLHAQSPGVGKDEIRIGQTMPYSGNASAYGVVGRAMVAYFDKLNREQGGINGRKIIVLLQSLRWGICFLLKRMRNMPRN